MLEKPVLDRGELLVVSAGRCEVGEDAEEPDVVYALVYNRSKYFTTVVVSVTIFRRIDDEYYILAPIVNGQPIKGTSTEYVVVPPKEEALLVGNYFALTIDQRCGIDFSDGRGQLFERDDWWDDWY